MNETQLKNEGYKKFDRKNAIALMCRECYGFEGHYGGIAGTPFQMAGSEVKECDSPKCPLFCFRNGRDERPTRKIKKLSEEHKKKLLETHKQSKKTG